VNNTIAANKLTTVKWLKAKLKLLAAASDVHKSDLTDSGAVFFLPTLCLLHTFACGCCIHGNVHACVFMGFALWLGHAWVREREREREAVNQACRERMHYNISC